MRPFDPKPNHVEIGTAQSAHKPIRSRDRVFMPVAPFWVDHGTGRRVGVARARLIMAVPEIQAANWTEKCSRIQENLFRFSRDVRCRRTIRDSARVNKARDSPHRQTCRHPTDSTHRFI